MMRPRLSFALLSCILVIRPLLGQTAFKARFDVLAADPALADSTRLHRLFDLDWERTLVEFPEYATYAGVRGHNHRWTELSGAAIARRKTAPEDVLRVMRAIDRTRLSPADQLNYDLFKRAAEFALEGNRFPSELLAINQRSGPQYLAATLSRSPSATIQDYNDLQARLDALGERVDRIIVLLRRGVAAGVTPPQVTLRDVPAQVAALIVEDPLTSPLLEPWTRIPTSFSEAERERIRQAAVTSYRARARPAYDRLHAFLRDDYIPRARTSIAAGSLPDGEAWYAYRVREQTTTTRTPREIHDIGLAEVTRIRAQMDSVIRSTGFTGSFEEFITMLRTDPRFFYTDSASLVQGYREVAKRIDPELIKLFKHLPRLPYGIETIPSYTAKSQTTAYYSAGSIEAKRPGLFFVNTYALDTRPKWEMEALTVHEAMPGHHLQIAIAQELTNLPNFRRFGGETAFVEGWGLYSESLGPELGLYKDPYSKFGQLTYEMWRAVRLVIDTGIHAFGWSREQAIEYFTRNAAKTENDIRVEVDRYIVMPAQALAYKTGEMKMKELRAYAERELGPRFDLRAFHDELLGQGALPLDILDSRMRAWVANRKGT
ncbi:MAG: DUF885 domain-containing protein [Gemmatimonadota bacterium]